MATRKLKTKSLAIKRPRTKSAPSSGRVLTAKNLSERSYQAIHTIPHGKRQKVMQKIIALAADAKKVIGPDWYEALLSGDMSLNRADG